MLFDDRGPAGDRRHRNGQTARMVRIADLHAEPLGHGGHRAQVHRLQRRRILGRAVQQGNPLANCGQPGHCCQCRPERRAVRRLSFLRQGEGDDTKRLGDLFHRRHAGREDQRPAESGRLQQHGPPGDVSGRNLDRRHVECRQHGQTVHVEGRRHEMHATLRAPIGQRLMVIRCQLQRAQHFQLAAVLAGVLDLIGSLGGPTRDQQCGVEGLELHCIGPGRRPGVDHGERPFQRSVVINACLGDDEHRLAHAPTSMNRLASSVRRSGRPLRISTIRPELRPSP